MGLPTRATRSDVMTDPLICAHPECDNEFEPKRFGGNTAYCSPECGKDDHQRRMQRPALVLDDDITYPKGKMTTAQFIEALAAIEAKLEAEGKPLTGPGISDEERQQRIAEHERRQAQEVAA